MNPKTSVCGVILTSEDERACHVPLEVCSYISVGLIYCDDVVGWTSVTTYNASKLSGRHGHDRWSATRIVLRTNIGNMSSRNVIHLSVSDCPLVVSSPLVRYPISLTCTLILHFLSYLMCLTEWLKDVLHSKYVGLAPHKGDTRDITYLHVEIKVRPLLHCDNRLKEREIAPCTT